MRVSRNLFLVWKTMLPLKRENYKYYNHNKLSINYGL